MFQGRYKRLLVDPEAGLGPLCHYIHLNPVRAGLVGAAALAAWPWTSLNWMCEPRGRSAWYRPGAALGHAGGLSDTPQGRRAYVDYLGWLAENEPEQRKLCFERMSKGWAVGTAEFRAGLVTEHREAAALLSGGVSDARERRDHEQGQ